MNFRFFDDLVGSAPGASQYFRFREGKHSANNYSAKTIENNFGKFTYNFKNFENISKSFSKI